MKKIMILGASILQLPAIKKAKELGLHVIAVDMNPDAIGFKEEGVQCEVVSTIDIPAVLECAQKNSISGIMTLASDMPMRCVAEVAQKMGLVGISPDTALKATNKAYMRDALKENNVPIPIFFKVNGYKQFHNAVKKIISEGYKCISKPADNSGSRGIFLLDNAEDTTIVRAYEYTKASSRSGAIMVEEYMEGKEVSVETLSKNGICNVIQITDKITTEAPYFVEMGHSQPSMIDYNMWQRIEQIAVAANKAIGIKDGPSHTEIKVTKDGPKIVELGARLGGDNITTHLVPLSTGVDMVECAIKIALGEDVDFSKKFHKASAIRYFNQEPGIITQIKGCEEANSMEYVKQISIVHDIGEKIDVIKSSNDRVGFVITQADDVKVAINACEKARDTIVVEVE